MFILIIICNIYYDFLKLFFVEIIVGCVVGGIVCIVFIVLLVCGIIWKRYEILL